MLPASPYCQRWDGRRHSFRHVSEGGFDARRYEVAPLDEDRARAFVERNHYSGSYPAAALRYALYEGAALVGVAVLSVPVQAKVLTGPFPTLLPYRESLDLGRFVLADAVPANGESWFLARAFDLARREGVRGVVSFSDPLPRIAADGRVVMPGHVGIIYQASNATYLGRGTARTLRLLPDGTVLSERTIQKVRKAERGHEAAERHLRSFGAPARGLGEAGADWLRRALPAIGVRTVRHAGNHRYAFSLDRRRTLVARPSHPYPKRTDGAALSEAA